MATMFLNVPPKLGGGLRFDSTAHGGPSNARMCRGVASFHAAFAKLLLVFIDGVFACEEDGDGRHPPLACLSDPKGGIPGVARG